MEQSVLSPFEDQLGAVHDIAPQLGETAAQVRLWSPYTPEQNLPFLQARRLKVLLQTAQPFPAFEVRQPPSGPAPRWCIYFCYLPDGAVQPYHRFTLERLVADGITPLVVCASKDPAAADQFKDFAIGGLVWKALDGYDFSGYTIGLQVLAQLGRPLSLFVMNDSVLGPFCKMADLFESSPWKVTGLVASASVEAHFQSFLLHIARFTQADMPALQRVFFAQRSFNVQGSVSFLQETRIPSGFKGHFSAGSLLAPAPGFKQHYYMLSNPAGLLKLGVPVIKRSVFGKFGQSYDPQAYDALLAAQGHPPMAQ